MFQKSLFTFLFAAIVSLLSGCNETTQKGSEFVGEWEKINNPNHVVQTNHRITIYHNSGNNYIIENGKKKTPATLKDGQLQISGGFISYIIDNATGNLIGKGSEYRKIGNK